MLIFKGTPLQILMVSRMKNSTSIKTGKSLGDSIKKHILHKSLVSKTPKRSNTTTPSSFDVSFNKFLFCLKNICKISIYE